MYKTRLQELCQKRQWALPNYTCAQYGPEHEARFAASVSVNGTSFDTMVAFNSSKLAHDYVARLALLHFTSPTDSDPSILAEKPEQNLEETQESVVIKSDSTRLDHGVRFLQCQDIDSQNKNQLLKYAKQRNFDLPSYSSKSNGPLDSLFKATVGVSEQVFESRGSFDTPKEAQNDAAKTVSMSLLVENFPKDELRAYKNLLQELSQGEGFCLPVYRTTKFGVSHNPAFSSIVELEGETFHGRPAKSKKLAEQESARVAYLALTNRGASRKASKSTSEYEYGEKNETDYKRGKLDLSSLSMPNSSATNSSTGTSTTYLLCNKVRVYREFPSYSFPKGIVVLPFGADNWVAVSLEFPNEQTN